MHKTLQIKLHFPYQLATLILFIYLGAIICIFVCSFNLAWQLFLIFILLIHLARIFNLYLLKTSYHYINRIKRNEDGVWKIAHPKDRERRVELKYHVITKYFIILYLWDKKDSLIKWRRFLVLFNDQLTSQDRYQLCISLHLK